jgi:flagellar biosynthesis/type III secretory pathway chaperone
MYADDSTIYMSATAANEVTEILNEEVQSVLELLASNKLVQNISKTKSIVFGTIHSLSSRPQMNLVMNGVAVEQVEEAKLYYLRF